MRKSLWLLVLPGVFILWWAFDHSGSAVTAHFAPVRRVKLESIVPTNGKVEPAEWATARAEVAGIVRSVLVQRGQNVKAGQTLVTLDTSAARADLAAALARREESQAEVNTLGQGGKAATVASLNDQIQSARTAVDVARRIFESDQRLLDKQAVTKLQVQNDADAVKRAQENLTALENQRRTVVTATDRQVAQARLQDSDAAVALAQRRIAFGVVKAPISGTVYSFDLKMGAYLEIGKEVAQIGDLDRVKVAVYVDEPDLGRVGLGMPVKITSDSHPGRQWWGHVTKLPTEVVSLQARTVGEVSTIIDNPDHDLIPGITIYASIISKTVDNALVVPKAALRGSSTAHGVYKLKDKVVVWTPVQTGISDINNVQVTSGLREGDEVLDRIVDPTDAEVKNGMQVKPVF
jgi:HlyD family secretion protein